MEGLNIHIVLILILHKQDKSSRKAQKIELSNAKNSVWGKEKFLRLVLIFFSLSTWPVQLITTC